METFSYGDVLRLMYSVMITDRGRWQLPFDDDGCRYDDEHSEQREQNHTNNQQFRDCKTDQMFLRRF